MRITISVKMITLGSIFYYTENIIMDSHKEPKEIKEPKRSRAQSIPTPKAPTSKVPSLKLSANNNDSQPQSKSHSPNKEKLYSSSDSGSINDLIKPSPSSRANDSDSLDSPQQSTKNLIRTRTINPHSIFSNGKSHKLTNSGSSLSSPSTSTSTSSPTTQTNIRQYSSEVILLEPPLSHEYLLSLSPEKLKSYYSQALKAYANQHATADGFHFYKQEDGCHSPKNKHNKEKTSQIIETLTFKKDGIIHCYLFDRNGQLDTEGAGGPVFIAYKFPDDLHTTTCYAQMIYSSTVVKEKKTYYKSGIQSTVFGLKETEQYIYHCEEGSSVYYLLNQVMGPNMLDYIYKRNHKLHKNEINHIVGRRYIKPEHKLTLIINAFNELNLFHEKTNHFHTDIKTQNFVLNSRLQTKLIDMDDIRKEDTILTVVVGSVGYIVPEVDPKSKFRGRYTKKSDRYALWISIAELLSNLPYQKILREKIHSSAKEYPDDYTHDDYYNMISDIFIESLLIEKFVQDNIHNKWMDLSDNQINDYLADSFKDFIPEDIALLSRTDKINELIFRLYILPSLIQLIVKNTCENPALRPDDSELPNILEKLLELQAMYQQLCFICRQQKPLKMQISIPELECLNRVSIMIMATNESSKACEIKLSLTM
jgi:hypothetical protein